jgi:O-antigen/teichoic acid export membrane protein
LQKFARNTALYTIGNVVYRGGSFLLIPLYVHRLAPAEYGALELIYVTAAIFQTAFAAGIAHSALRFYFEHDKPEDRHSVLSTAFLASFVFTTCGAILLCFAAPYTSRLVLGTSDYALAFRLVAISMVLEISREISLALIRAREAPGLFVMMSLVQLATQVGANLYTVVHLRMGVLGVITGNLVAVIAVWIVLTVSTLRHCGLHFEHERLWPVVRYGAPLLVSTLSFAIFTSLDRYFLGAYKGLSATGTYALALRIGTVIPVLLLTPFTNSYGPFRFSVMKQNNAPQIYSRVLTYFVFGASFIAVAIAATGEEIVKLVAAPEYWAAYRVVPLVVLPGVIAGVSYCFQTGIFIQKQTRQILWVSLCSGALNLLLMRLLIPRWGMYGAAVGSVLVALYVATHTYVAAQRLYPVKYELGRILKAAAAALAIVIVALNLHLPSVSQGIAVKGLLVLLFPVLLLLTRSFTAEEKVKVKEIWAKGTNKLQSRGAVA